MIASAPFLENVALDGHQVAKDLVRWALAIAGAKQAERVEHLRVRLGPHPAVTSRDLELSIRLLTRYTIAEGATVEVIEVEEPGVTIDSVLMN